MKQYLNSEQTAKLIELGFEKPKNERWVLDVANGSTPSIQNLVKRQDYSIGELLSFLPSVISDKKFDYAIINIFHDTINWVVGYEDVDGVMRFITSDIELIDVLCTLCRKLKGEGVI